jgi:hypothetical protein
MRINVFLDMMPRGFIDEEATEYFLLEDGGSIFLRNFGKAVPDLTELLYRISYSYCLRQF